MDERFLQPQLLWGYFQRWVTRRVPETDRGRLQLLIYPTDRNGAYLLHGPKLYWKADTGESYFSNCSQNELLENMASLGEVQGYVYRNSNDNPIQWNSLDEFIEEMTR